MSIFTCDACHYTFEYPALPARCPDCGRGIMLNNDFYNSSSYPAVRPATKSEIADYWKYKKEFDAEEERLKHKHSHKHTNL